MDTLIDLYMLAMIALAFYLPWRVML